MKTLATLASLMLLLSVSLTGLAQDNTGTTVLSQVDTLLTQAETNLTNGDLNGGQSVLAGVRALLGTYPAGGPCTSVPQVDILLQQAVDAPDLGTAQALVSATRALLTPCLGQTGNMAQNNMGAGNQQNVVQPTSPPAAPPTAVPTPLPVEDERFQVGIQVQYSLDFNPDNQDGYFRSVADDLGLNWVKTQVRWEDIERERDTYDWAKLDLVMPSAQRFGIKNMLSIVTAPDWAREPGVSTAMHGPPADPADYVDFVLKILERYPGQVHAIEVWNEQNLSREWTSAEGLRATNYVELLRQTYEAVKAVEPGVIVISGALSPTGVNDGIGAWDDYVYMQQMIDAGMLNYTDCVGAHHNGYNIGPSVRWNAVPNDPSAIFRGPFDNPNHSWSFRSTLEGYWQRIQAAGFNTPLCVTEFGWAVSEDLDGVPAGFEFARDNTLEEQARWIPEAMTLMEDWGYVWLAFIWNFNYAPQAGWDVNNDNVAYSLIGPGFTFRPAYDAIREWQTDYLARTQPTPIPQPTLPPAPTQVPAVQPTQNVVQQPVTAPTATLIPLPTTTPLPLQPTVAPPTNTPAPPTQVPLQLIINEGANIRSGPGLGFAIQDALPANERVDLAAVTPDGEWYKIRYWAYDREGWVWAQIATPLEGVDMQRVPIDAGPPTPTPTPVVPTAPPATQAPASAVNLQPVNLLINPHPLVCNQASQLEVTVRNVGTEAASQGGIITIEAILVSTGAILTSTETVFPALGPNEQHTAGAAITVGVNFDELQQLRVTVDSDSRIVESNENDNRATLNSDYVLQKGGC